MKTKKAFSIAAFFTAMLGVSPALADSNAGLCQLISEMQTVFNTLRILAFIGAAFILASWAWDFIKGGDGKTSVVDTLKSKGISMIVGFAILFSVGIGISFLMNGNVVDCSSILTRW